MTRRFIAEYAESRICLHGKTRKEPCAACAMLCGADRPDEETPQTRLLRACDPESARMMDRMPQ